VTQWFTEHNGHLVLDDVELEFEVTTEIRHQLMKKAFKSASLTNEQREIINEIVCKGFATDSTIRLQKECCLSIPDPEIKAFLWEHITKPEKAMALSYYDYTMMLRTFFQPFIPYHYQLVEQYLDEFYLVAPDLMLKLDRSRANAFLLVLSPTIRADPEDEAKLRNLLGEALLPESPLNKLSFYVDYLRDQIHYVETLEKVQVCSTR
jgi:hypothetical protein